MPEAKNHADLYHRHGEADPGKWEEAQAVTGREADTVPENSTLGSRSVSGAENKAVQPAATEDKSLDGMTKDELLTEAERRNVEVAKSWTKGEILDALNG